MLAKGWDPGGVQDFQVPGSGEGALVGKELAPESGSKALLLSQTRRRQKSVLHSQENILQFRPSCQEECGDEPHSNCPAGSRYEPTRMLAHTNSLKALPYVDLSGCWFRKGK